MRRHPFFTAQRVIAMAHRGFHDHATTENTMEAFQRAVDLGYLYIESDIHVTSDGVPVLIHDPDLARVGGGQEEVSDLTWSQLSTRRLAHNEKVPRLEELLSTWPDIHLNLDAKVPEAVGAAARVITAAGAQERVCIGSFSHRSVLAARGHLPRAAHSASPLEVLRWRLGQAIAAHALMIPRQSGPIRLVTGRSVDRAHRRGVGVHVWTVNDADEMAQLIQLGVDGLMTDRADLLKDVLLAHRLWE